MKYANAADWARILEVKKTLCLHLLCANEFRIPAFSACQHMVLMDG